MDLSTSTFLFLLNFLSTVASNVTKARLSAGCLRWWMFSVQVCDSRVSKKVSVEISDDELFTGNHNHYFLPRSGAGACKWRKQEK